MHRIGGLVGKQAEGISLVAAGSVAFETACRAAATCIARRSVPVLADENRVVIPCALVNYALVNAVLNEFQINSATEKILNNPVIAVVFGC